MNINPASIVTWFRVALVFFAVYLKLETSTGDGTIAIMLAVGMFLDGVDGKIARLFHFEDEVGKLNDLYADHMTANAIWVMLAYVGSVSIWIPIIATSRDMAVDLLRQAGVARTGLNGFEQVADSRYGWLSASRAMRFFYGMLKATAWTLALTSSYLPIPYAVNALAWFTVAICLVRAIPAFDVGGKHLIYARG